MNPSKPPSELSLASRVNQEWNRLSKSERVVARYLAASPPEQIMLATAEEIGVRTGTSDATAVRTARRLGYGGLPDLKRSLGAAFAPAAAPQISSRLEISEAAGDLSVISSRVIDHAHTRIERTAEVIDQEQLGLALRLLASASEVLCYGWGTSELSARYLALKLNRMGKRARFSGVTGFALADDLLRIAPDHAVVVFAPGRVLPDLTLLFAHSRAVGAASILATEHEEQLRGSVDAVIFADGSSGGITAEPLTEMLVADMLALGLMAVDRERTVDSYELLTRLRKELVGEF